MFYYLDGKFKMENQNKKFGFVRANFNHIDKEFTFLRTGKEFLHIIFFKERNLYFCTGLTKYSKEKIPSPYDQHEFIEFYRKIPPRITDYQNEYKNHLKIVI